MHRRDVLRALGGAAAATVLGPLSPDEYLRLGEALHARLRPAGFRTLDAGQAELVAGLAELILPRTDTPGARDVRVPEFVDLLLTEWYPEAERHRLLAGLERLAAEVRGADLAEVLERLDGAGGPVDSAGGALARLKSHTIHGYFTSREVQTGVLRTVIIPGRYDGCPAAEAR